MEIYSHEAFISPVLSYEWIILKPPDGVTVYNKMDLVPKREGLSRGP